MYTVRCWMLAQYLFYFFICNVGSKLAKFKFFNCGCVHLMIVSAHSARRRPTGRAGPFGAARVGQPLRPRAPWAQPFARL